MGIIKQKCDLLSENLAHPAFYENRPETSILMCNCATVKKLNWSVPKLRSEIQRGCRTQLFKEIMFVICYGKFNISVYYRSCYVKFNLHVKAS